MIIKHKNKTSLNNLYKEMYKGFKRMDEFEGVNSVYVEQGRKRATKYFTKIKKNYPDYFEKLADFEFISELLED